MADIARFALELTDNLSGPSKQATASIDKLKSSLSDAKNELAKYEAKLRIANDIGNVAGHERYGAAVASQTRRIADLTAKLGEAQAPAGGLVSSLENMAGKGGLAAVGLGAVTVAAGLAIGVLETMVAVTERLVVTSLDVVNANDQMRASFEALGGGGAGAKTLEMLDKLAERLPQSREQLAKWTKQIEATGVTDLSKVRSELIATASAQAIMGEEGANAYRKIQERVRLAVEEHHGLKLAEKSLKGLYEAGLNVSDVAARMGLTTQQLGAGLKSGTVDAQKFGDALHDSLVERGKGPLDAMMNSLATMSGKAKEALGHLFDEVDTTPLTQALRNLIALGDQGAPSGEAIKMGLVPAMNAVIATIGHAITEAEIFFLEIEVRALEAYIVLKPVIRAFEAVREAVAPLAKIGGAVLTAPKIADTSSSTQQAADAGHLIGGALLSSFIGPTTSMITVVFQALGEMGSLEAQAVAHSSGQAVGKAAVAGMRDGIGAHSPSVEAIKVGMDLSAGLGLGIARSTEPAAAVRTVATSTLGDMADIGAARARSIPVNAFGGSDARPGASSGAQQTQNTIGPIHIAITAPDGVTDAQQLSITGLATALERYQLGTGR